MHEELAYVWRDIDAILERLSGDDPRRRQRLLAGGDLALVEEMANDFETRTRVWREAREMVYNIINCSKPMVSAIHGPAVGAGLVCGILADVSIAAKTARIIDGHTRLGSRRATTPRSSGHCCAAWPRPSTTCCCRPDLRRGS